MRVETINPKNIILSEVVSQTYLVRFLLNPSCLSLGQNSIKPEDLQASGIDIEIRKFFHFRLKYRYDLLKKAGFIVRKSFLYK